jgi:hypothetical protein
MPQTVTVAPECDRRLRVLLSAPGRECAVFALDLDREPECGPGALRVLEVP